MIFKIGHWLDRQYYKFFPAKDEGLGHDNTKDLNGSGQITDFRGMSDEEFLNHAKPDLDALERLRQIKYSIYQTRKKLAIPVCAVLLPLTGYID